MDLFYVVIDNLNKNKRVAYSLQHSIGRKIIQYAATNVYQINNFEIEIINSKPKFKYSDKQFSISHSNNVVIVGFDDNPLGIDIEYMKERDFKSLAKRMSFEMTNNTLQEFYELWTLYEAKYKLGNDTKYYTSKKILNNYILTVASKNEIKNININEINQMSILQYN